MDRQQANEIARFLIAGIAAIVTDFSVYFVLCQALPPSASKTISFICGGIVSYVLNKHWAFKSSRRSSAEAIRFAVFNLGTLVQNVLTNHTMLNLWPGKLLSALLVATDVTSIAAYIGFKWWVFRTH